MINAQLFNICHNLRIIISISNIRHSNVTNNAFHDNLGELLHFGAREINNKISAPIGIIESCAIGLIGKDSERRGN